MPKVSGDTKRNLLLLINEQWSQTEELMNDEASCFHSIVNVGTLYGQVSISILRNDTVDTSMSYVLEYCGTLLPFPVRAFFILQAT